MNEVEHRRLLISILQGAYSGELAAARAYSGHWRSLKDSAQRDSIRQIEGDEWHHRETTGRFLSELGSGPLAWRELFFGTIGNILSCGCYISGWYMPMYFAGRLEAANVREYEDAASHAAALGLAEYQRDLLAMAVKEKEHEQYFAALVANRKLTSAMRLIFGWGPPGEPRIGRQG